MADDQGQKITSIDDLVNELTKKNPPPAGGGPTPPPPSSGPVPSFPKPPTTPQPEIPKPRFTPPVPMPPSPPTVPSGGGGSSPVPPARPPLTGGLAPASGPAPIKEYQSSIRTMKDDISILKQGQRPAGISVPRKIETPTPVAPTVPKPITPPSPGQFKVPSVNLGQAERTGPLPQTKGPTLPASKPAPPPIGGPQKSLIYAPPLPTGGISSGRNRLFIIIAGVAIIFAGLYWFLIIRPQVPQIVEETPTPSPTATPIATLNSIFQGISNIPTSFENNSDGTLITADLNTRINSATIAGGEFQDLSNTSILNIVAFLDAENVNHPQGLVDLQLNEFLPLLYGQIESFDSTGQIKAGTENEKRLVLINETASSLTASQIIRDWELTLSADLKSLFGLGQSKENEFLDNVYREVNIRYKNFPYANRSIDYAFVTALNGKSYLVIANSREAMFSTIDKLKGF